jgi:hypothetical protein
VIDRWSKLTNVPFTRPRSCATPLALKTVIAWEEKALIVSPSAAVSISRFIAAFDVDSNRPEKSSTEDLDAAIWNWALRS